MDINLIIALVLIFIFSLIGTFIIKEVALRKKVLDVPNKRSSHNVPTPRIGGLAIAISWFISIAILWAFEKIPTSLFIALFSGIPISFIGFIDDLKPLAPTKRFVVQIISTAIAIFFLGGLRIIDFGFFKFESIAINSVISVIAVVWLSNLFNFIDGIDGYLGVETIFICISIYILFGFDVPLFLASATAGFLIWNWQPAKIFMGDVGSTLIGFTIGILMIYYQNLNQSSVFFWIILSSLFWFDATITLFRRWRNNEKLSDAHRNHAYQRIVQYGFSHQRTVLFAILINSFILGTLFLIHDNPKLIVPVLMIIIFGLYLVLKLIDKRFPFQNKN